MLYITKLKTDTIPEQNTSVNTNLINELFGDAPVTTVTKKYVRTSTKWLNDIEAEMCEISATTIENTNRMSHKLDAYLTLNPHPSNHYTVFQIPKKTGGMRTIEAPDTGLKEVQKDIANFLYYGLRVQVHDSAYAYIKGRSIIDAVNEHKQNKSQWFLKLDLKDFFGSCSSTFIKTQLQKIYPFNFECMNPFIDNMIKIATLNYKLPQGTPLSPILTNILMVPVDSDINKVINNLVSLDIIPKQRYVYTRYADDMLISAKTKFDKDEIIKGIRLALKETPFIIKDEKTRFGSASGRNWNLGLMLNKDNNITIGYKKKKDIKEMVYYYLKFKDNYELEQCQHLLGNLSWLQNVEPDYYIGLLQYFHKKYNIDVMSTLLTQIKSY